MALPPNPKLKKWDNAYQGVDISSALASRVLAENAYLLPQKAGDALDLACGRGGNALFLAKRGFTVDALDISTVVLEQLESFINDKPLAINCIKRDVEAQGLLPQKQYDVIVVSYFLDRSLFSQIIDALKPAGLLFYQTWSQLSTDETKGPNNPAYRLKSGELLKLSAEMRVIYYREDGLQGDIKHGIRNEALLICQKPDPKH